MGINCHQKYKQNVFQQFKKYKSHHKSYFRRKYKYGDVAIEKYDFIWPKFFRG